MAKYIYLGGQPDQCAVAEIPLVGLLVKVTRLQSCISKIVTY